MSVVNPVISKFFKPSTGASSISSCPLIVITAFPTTPDPSLAVAFTVTVPSLIAVNNPVILLIDAEPVSVSLSSKLHVTDLLLAPDGSTLALSCSVPPLVVISVAPLSVVTVTPLTFTTVVPPPELLPPPPPPDDDGFGFSGSFHSTSTSFGFSILATGTSILDPDVLTFAVSIFPSPVTVVGASAVNVVILASFASSIFTLVAVSATTKFPMVPPEACICIPSPLTSTDSKFPINSIKESSSKASAMVT